MTSVLGKQICMQMLINIKFEVEDTIKYSRKILLWMSSTFIHGSPFLSYTSFRIDGSDFYPCPIYPNFLTIVRSVGYLSVATHSLQLSSLVLDLFVMNRTLIVNHYCFLLFKTHPADYALRDIWSQCSNFVFKFNVFWNNFL